MILKRLSICLLTFNLLVLPAAQAMGTSRVHTTALTEKEFVQILHDTHDPKELADLIKNTQENQRDDILRYIDQHPNRIPLFVQAGITLINTPETWWLMYEIEQRDAQAVKPWLKLLLPTITPHGDDFDWKATDYIFSKSPTIAKTSAEFDPILQWARKHLYQDVTAIYEKAIHTLSSLLKEISRNVTKTTTTKSHGSWEIESFKQMLKQDAELYQLLWKVVQHGKMQNYCLARYDQSIQQVLTQFERHKAAIIDTLKNAHEHEAHATKDGAYVFYHAQNWTVHLMQDFYKALFNAMHVNQKIGPEFIPLRVPARFEMDQERKEDALFLNASILGNARFHGESTFEYFILNSSFSVIGCVKGLSDMIKSFHVSPVAYEKSLHQLCELHTQANPTGLGNLLQIVIPRNKINLLVKSTGPGKGEYRKVLLGDQRTDDMERIAHALRYEPNLLSRSNEQAESIVYTIPLNKAALDQKTGHKIYEFNAADPVKFKEYVAARDELIEKIKKDYADNQATTS